MSARQPGKRATQLTVALGLAALSVAIVSGMPWIREEYHIRRLASQDEDVRLAAAAALGNMRSVRAVPHLIRLVNEKRQDTAVFLVGSFGTKWALTPLFHAIVSRFDLGDRRSLDTRGEDELRRGCL